MLGISLKNAFFDLLTDRIELQDCIYQVRERLSIIPSDKKLALIEIRLAKDKDMDKTFQKKLGYPKGYDFIFLDADKHGLFKC